MSQRRHEAPELASAARRMMRALAVRATEGDTEAIEQLALLRDDLDAALGSAIAGARVAAGYSWHDVAQLVGSTRQNAFQRWGKAEPPVTFACEHSCGQLFGSDRQRMLHQVRDHGDERCEHVTVPKPLQCGMPPHHAPEPHVMAAADEHSPDNLINELEGSTR